MTDFRDQDLSGARFERVSLRGASISRADLRDLRIRGAALHGTRMSGVELRQCLRIVLNEEWEHRLYAERDLARR